MTMNDSNNKKENYNADVTEEDLKALGEKRENIHHDNGADQLLENRERPADFSGKDLDVPGRQMEENKNRRTLKDEENELYSESTSHDEKQ